MNNPIDVLSYSLAKKLAKLGFDEECYGHYITEAGWQLDLSEGSYYEVKSKNSLEDGYCISAPKIVDVLFWLSTELEISVEPYSRFRNYDTFENPYLEYSFRINSKKGILCDDEFKIKYSYKGAIIAGIREALKILSEQKNETD